MGGRVLIIDDDPALLRLMSMAFQQAGFGVVAADNGRKGIRLASAHRPDLVVTDIVMPDIEGIGAIRAMKQVARPPKIIAISGAGRARGADYLSWAKHLGADEVLAKPFRMSELVKMSQSVIAGGAAHPSVQPQTALGG
ncbi:MAG: response regulator [Phenylobacterium sp.]|uniref:response regulator transcription factor n=1 Tax=Phenylobacterium sp. TaxID=1871053 RepID=UPI001A38B315|nr:response regulator [Phenylobacterium sp.]MBL8771538.1 response regulator [Phenylobacterium sp.]